MTATTPTPPQAEQPPPPSAQSAPVPGAPAQPSDLSAERFREQRITHWDQVARQEAGCCWLGGCYHRRLAEVYSFLIPPGQRVLEIGCGEGDLLTAVGPACGVGVDFSPEMIATARRRHPDPHVQFIQADAHGLSLPGQTFDFVVLSDLVNDLWDVQAVLERLRPVCTPRTRLILNVQSHLWEWPLRLAERVGFSRPKLVQNWLTREDLSGLLRLAGFEVLRQWQEVLWPLPTPLLGALLNRVLVRVWPFQHAALTNFVVARPGPEPWQPSSAPAGAREAAPQPRVSVVIPARNEAGNIAQIVKRVPEMGAGTELIFVEGHSQDGTYAAIERAIAEHPQRHCRLLRQSGAGKGDAVRCGFAQATGAVLMILDADLTVPPEDLPRFYDAIRSGKGEFINGVRLVYPMEQRAMRLANLIANKFFGLTFSWLLGQPVKDTLCGTKVLYKEDYERIVANRTYFGDFDPFGDFDLLFGAAKLNLKIVDLPVRYRQRTYGSTNIQRWRHGWMLLKMVAFAARRLKCV